MKKIKLYQKAILGLAAIGAIIYYTGAADSFLSKANNNTPKQIPVKTPTLPASGNLDLDSISGTNVIKNSYLLIKKGVKKDTAVLIYNHPNACCPGNVQPYLLFEETFDPHFVKSGKVKPSTPCPPDKFEGLYLNAIKENVGLERTIDSLNRVIKKMNVAPGPSTPLDNGCGDNYGLENSKLAKKL